MTLEKEILVMIDKEEFEQVLVDLTKKLGKPRKRKRLGIDCSDYGRQDIDNRIRITDGQVELMQKVGGWNDEKRQELRLEVEDSPEMALRAFKIIQNLLIGDRVETCLIQHENYIFETKDFEIKLTRQTGKKTAYNYEVEVKDHDLDPKKVSKELGLPDKVPVGHTPAFWTKWNDGVNLRANDLSDEELLGIIRKFF